MVTLPFLLARHWFSDILNWSYTEGSNLGNIFLQHFFLIFLHWKGLNYSRYVNYFSFLCVRMRCKIYFDQTLKILNIWATMYKITKDSTITTKTYRKNWKSYTILTPVLPNHFFSVSKSLEICCMILFQPILIKINILKSILEFFLQCYLTSYMVLPNMCRQQKNVL